MSSAHLTARQIEDFKARRASPAELLAVMTHIASCETCAVEVSSEPKTRRAVDALQSDLRVHEHSTHLTYDELAASVDGSLGEVEREILESHVEICASCAGELAELRAFKAEMTTYPEVERRPIAAPTFREKVLAFLRRPSLRIPVQVAAAATVVLLCVLIATIVLRKGPAVRDVSELQQKDESQPDKNSNSEPQQLSRPNAEPPAIEIADSIQDGGGVLSMDKEGNVTGLESLPPGYQRDVRTALKNKRVDTPPLLKELIGKNSVLMGSAGEGAGFSLIDPIGTIVRSDRPTFRWKPLNGATTYVVAVFDSNFNKVASSEPQKATHWSPASSLKRSETYSWQVTAIKDGKELVSPAPPAPDAKFKVLESSKERELEEAKRRYPNSHLLLGILYERAGLLDDAEHELKIVSASNPKSQTVHKLVDELKALRSAR